MPIYEYSCPRCGQGREVIHKMSETPEVHCADCPDQRLERQVSAARVPVLLSVAMDQQYDRSTLHAGQVQGPGDLFVLMAKRNRPGLVSRKVKIIETR